MVQVSQMRPLIPAFTKNRVITEASGNLDRILTANANRFAILFVQDTAQTFFVSPFSDAGIDEGWAVNAGGDNVYLTFRDIPMMVGGEWYASGLFAFDQYEVYELLYDPKQIQPQLGAFR